MFGFSQIQLIGLVVLITIVGLMGWRVKYLENENSDLHTQIGVYKTQLNTLAETIKSKDRDIDLQNKTVEDLKKEAETRAKDAKEALIEASKKAAVTERKAADILASVPKTSDLCKETDSLLNSYIKDRTSTLGPENAPIPPSTDLKLTSNLLRSR